MQALAYFLAQAIDGALNGPVYVPTALPFVLVRCCGRRACSAARRPSGFEALAGRG